MTRTKKIILGTFFSIVTLGGIVSYAAPGHLGKHGGMTPEKAEYIVNKVSKKLDLNAEQKQNLDNLKDTILEQKSLHKKENPREALQALLAEPVLDEAAILTMVQERTTSMNQAAPQIVSSLAAFTNSLSDEQRANIVKFSQKFKKHRRGH